MSGLSSILLTGLSSMRASQTAIGVASQNIANANTPGYVRAEVTLAPRTQYGPAAGVEVTGVRRAADRFLATASYIAAAAQGSATARADILARAQSSFGDPNSETSMFATLDQFWSSVTEIGVDPSSTLRRDDAVASLQTMYSEVQRVGSSLQTMIGEADQRIGDAVADAQSLINRISELNKQIQLTNRDGVEATAAENAQSALIDQLSALLDVRVAPLNEGGVQVRTSGGALLVGVDPATITYTPNSSAFANHGVIQLNAGLSTQSNLEPFLMGGEIKGLLQVRDQDLPQMAEALGGFAAALGDTLNEVHNQNTSTPAVGELVGRQTGLLNSDSLNFTGRATVGVVDASGTLRQRLTIDFDAGTITAEDPAATVNFNNDIDSFINELGSLLAVATPAGGATFQDGVMEMNVGSGGGFIIQQDATNPSDRAGRGFSHFFGLNDLVSRPTPMFFETGLSGSDAHGLDAGGTISYQVRDAAGRLVASPELTISGGLAAPGSSWDNLTTALSSTMSPYGSFAMNATTGQMEFTPSNGYSITLLDDSTERGATGVAFSELHGLSPLATAGRAIELNVNDLISADPTRLAVARPNMSAGIGQRVLETGDNRGSTALVAARDTVRSFPKAGVLSAQSTTLATYSARLAGEAGRMSADAQRSANGAKAVATAASDRREQLEGVSLDDELLKMTTYQNSYAAAARVIQAVTEMFDVLLAVGVR